MVQIKRVVTEVTINGKSAKFIETLISESKNGTKLWKREISDRREGYFLDWNEEARQLATLGIIQETVLELMRRNPYFINRVLTRG